jgi:hypothetical protein
MISSCARVLSARLRGLIERPGFAAERGALDAASGIAAPSSSHPCIG